ncbi:MAG: hypothetical protein EHM13_08575 [Acidobacteria bacterium]|nr:MAG: hypothetical protein EHM13_08575 [Acidobacteriota bacterium]
MAVPPTQLSSGSKSAIIRTPGSGLIEGVALTLGVKDGVALAEGVADGVKLGVMDGVEAAPTPSHTIVASFPFTPMT